VRWDLDYDGKPDTAWEAVGVRTIVANEIGWIAVKVEVRDGRGNVAADTALVRVTEAKPAPVPDPKTPVTPAQGGCGCGAAGRDGEDLGGGLLWGVGVIAGVVLRRGRGRERGRGRS
jgi:hypothetical protein